MAFIWCFLYTTLSENNEYKIGKKIRKKIREEKCTRSLTYYLSYMSLTTETVYSEKGENPFKKSTY